MQWASNKKKPIIQWQIMIITHYAMTGVIVYSEPCKQFVLIFYMLHCG